MIMLIVNSAAALVAMWVSICATNRMSRRTPLQIRLAYILMGVGSLAALLAPGMSERTYGWAETLTMLLIALLGTASHYYWASLREKNKANYHHSGRPADRKH